MIIPEIIPEKTLFKIGELANLFSVSTRSARNWINCGKIRVIRLPHGMIRVLRSDIITFIENQKTGNSNIVNNEKIIQYKIINNMRSRLSHIIRGKEKGESTAKLLGCSYSYFIKYIESQFKEGMSFKNYGQDGWVIDHIIPCAKFDLSKTEHQKKCFHFTNLRPLWAFENISKKDKITHRSIAEYFINFHKFS